MKTFVIIFIFILPLPLAGQNDTIIFFSELGRSLESDSDALFYEKITQNTRKKSEHARYPKYAYNKNITGTVFVKFIVMKDGTIKGVEVLKRANRFLDLEALRIIKSMPATWNPGVIGNKKVNMMMAVPVIFQIGKTFTNAN